jgi:hypothetical protein
MNVNTTSIRVPQPPDKNSPICALRCSNIGGGILDIFAKTRGFSRLPEGGLGAFDANDARM